MTAPLAYFLTWTTYATHLRGHHSGSTDHRRNQQGNAQILPSPRLEQRDRDRLSDIPYTLTPLARTVVTQAIAEHAAFKQWEILAIEVRSNHVHLLICSNTPPEAVMTSCKRWATRALREAGLLGKDAKVWTRHGSTRWINDEDSLNKAFQYITELQDGPKAEKRYPKTRDPN